MHRASLWDQPVVRIGALLLYLVLFLGFAKLAQQLPSNNSLSSAFWSAWIGALTAISLVFLFSRDADNPQRLRFMIAGGIIVDIVCNRIPLSVPDQSKGLFEFLMTAMGNLGMLSAAIGAGVIVARGLLKPNYLVMAAIVGAITDIFSVNFGPAKFTLGSQAFYYVSYQWGLIGQGGVVPNVGAGDFIFLALYFAGARRFGLSQARTFIAMCAAFAVGFMSLLLNIQALPALPFMAVFLMLVHGRELWRQMREAKDQPLEACKD